MTLRDATFTLAAFTLAASIAVTASTATRADPVADFYKGKTVTLVVSSSAGGGFDVVGRLVARFMPRHVPGNPVFLVRNMPGAGGILAAKYFYAVAPTDGTVIGALVNTTPFEPLFGTKEATYDPSKSEWLGSPGAEVGSLGIWADSPAKTLADVRQRETTVGAAGANSTPSFYARMINTVLGTKLKIVLGYPGQNEIFLAMERGEVEGHPSMLYSGVKSSRPNWIKDKKVNFIVQYGAAPEKEFGNTPFIGDLITKPEDRPLVAAAVAPLAIGRPYMAPPGTPPERVAALRKALAATFADPEFRAEAERMQLGFTTAVSGESMKQKIAEAYKAAPDVVARLRALAQP
jgi:tripartite-type tricarboxylate transporter receptor subunit TctC